VNASTAFSSGLAYVESNGKVIMQGDNTTWLASGVGRSRYEIGVYPGWTDTDLWSLVSEYRVMPSTIQGCLFLMLTKFPGDVVSATAER
jgi:hypothetical protein